MHFVVLVDQLSHNQIEEDVADKNIYDDDELSLDTLLPGRK